MTTDIFEGNLTFKSFTSFVWPSILMMLVMSLYYTIDSIFVSNLIGAEGLAAINIAYPIQGIMWGVGVMISAGSSTLVGIELGKGNTEKANSKFTQILVFSAILGTLFTTVCLIFKIQIVTFLGATEALTADCYEFLNVFLWGCPLAFCGTLFEFYIRVDGKPTFTIALYIAGGILHLGMDYILMGPLHQGLHGAAIANVCGLGATALMGLLYFIFWNERLKFRRFRLDPRYLAHSIVNGLPELVSEGAAGIKVFFYNIVIIKIAGSTGIAAAAIVLNLHYLFMSLYIGYVAGVQPLISYYYGAKAYEKINKVIKYTEKFVVVSGIIIAAICFLGAPLIVNIYERPGSELYDLTLNGIRLISISLLFVGANVFVSGFFVCYGQGLISALVSLSQGLVTLVIGLYIFTYLFGMNGAWLAVTFAEVITLCLSFFLMNKYKTRYNFRL